MKQKYFFLDLDGTARQTIDGKAFVDNPSNQKAMPGALQAIEYFASIGFRIVGITNQGGCVAINPETEHSYKSIDNAIIEQQVTLNIFSRMEKILFCPTYSTDSYCYEVTRDSAVLISAPTSNSEELISCRKPGHGMILNAVRDNIENVNWKQSWMVGDRDEDQLCAAGATINFIWANVFRSYFEKEAIELPQQQTRMIEEFKKLLWPNFYF